jgi:tetrahydromethanopterin S-methyltransferase subunit C
MACLGFSLTLIIGLWVDNPFITVVQRAIVVLVIFYVIGCLLSVLGQKVIDENFEAESKAIQEKYENQLLEVSEQPLAEAEGQKAPQVS